MTAAEEKKKREVIYKLQRHQKDLITYNESTVFKVPALPQLLSLYRLFSQGYLAAIGALANFCDFGMAPNKHD